MAVAAQLVELLGLAKAAALIDVEPGLLYSYVKPSLMRSEGIEVIRNSIIQVTEQMGYEASSNEFGIKVPVLEVLCGTSNHDYLIGLKAQVQNTLAVQPQISVSCMPPPRRLPEAPHVPAPVIYLPAQEPAKQSLVFMHASPLAPQVRPLMVPQEMAPTMHPYRIVPAVMASHRSLQEYPLHEQYIPQRSRNKQPDYSYVPK
jgi:hypothetical protein